MMNFLIKGRTFITLALDIIIGFFALFITIIFRYGPTGFRGQLDSHMGIFTIIICIFIFSFYIFNLYSLRFNKNITEFNDSFIKSIIVSFALSILFFYTLGSLFNLAPKTNLIIFTAIFGLMDFYIRIIVKRYYVNKNINRKILIINNDENILIPEILGSSHSGYEIVEELKNFDYEKILSINPDTVIIGSIDTENLPQIYSLTKNQIYVSTIQSFYEQMFQKVPTEIITKENIIEYINKPNKLFVVIKRGIDVVMSIFFLIALSPISILVSIFIKISSRGPVLFEQVRVGANDRLFTIYKFRSMYIDSEKDGPVWTVDDQTDNRITALGRILRKSHLDEIPQLVNILNGDLSFVGPRPERPEFTKIIEEKIPYYILRHNAKPGLTGWAQINYRYGASIADASEKLKYDFYYIKNKNIFLDILIIAKTFAMILKKH